jgi:hypothetical protein
MQQQYSDDDYDVTQNPDNTGFTGGLAKLDQQITQPAQPFDRSSFRDAINGAPNAYEVLDRYGLKADKSGRVTLPTGEIMDVVRGAGAGGTTGQWMGVGEMHNGQITTYAPQSQGSVAGTINGGNAAASGGATSPLNGPMRDAILAQLQKAQQPVDPNDPSIKPSVDAYRAEATRGLDDTRNALAERAYATGNLGQGGYDQLQQQAREKMGLGVANFSGQAMQNAQAQKQAMLQQLLGLGNSNLQFSDQLGLNYSQLGQQASQFGQDLGYRYANLNQQDRQFNDDLGYRYANSQNQADRDALLAVLGGGQ